jgi:hypothetical protein
VLRLLLSPGLSERLVRRSTDEWSSSNSKATGSATGTPRPPPVGNPGRLQALPDDREPVAADVCRMGKAVSCHERSPGDCAGRRRSLGGFIATARTGPHRYRGGRGSSRPAASQPVVYACAQRARAAFLAISERSSGVSFSARAFPPFKPPSRPVRCAGVSAACGSVACCTTR